MCGVICSTFSLFFFFNDPAPTEIYTLSLHDALPIWPHAPWFQPSDDVPSTLLMTSGLARSEEHTSELQSQSNRVCRLLLEKTKTKAIRTLTIKSKNVGIILQRPRCGE